MKERIYAVFIVFMAMILATSCTKTKKTTIPVFTEHMSYELNGTVHNVNISNVLSDITSGEYFEFHIGEVQRNLYIDATIRDSFVTNVDYNSDIVSITSGFLDNNENRTTDTFFDYVDMKITYQDKNWIQGEFIADSCKVRDLITGEVQGVLLTITEGEFSLKY